ncbi:MAG TPA: Ig-like domain-containing protein [Streptosporangiaceae bacterium]
MADESSRRGNGVLGDEQSGEHGTHRHRRPRAPRGTSFKLGVAAAVIAALAIAAGVTGLTLTAGTTPSQRTAEMHGTGQGGAGQGGAGQGGVGQGGVGRASTPFRVRSVTPASGSARLSGALSVQVSFTGAVAGDSATPELSPSVAGQWQVSGRQLTFTPNVPLPPSTRFTLRIPAGNAGVRSAAGRFLARALTTHFKTAGYSQLRLAQVLAALGYLPLAWQPGAGDRMTSDPAGGQVASQPEMAYSPPSGSFTWQHGYPAALRAQWRPGRANPLVQGAVMAFRAQHRMAITPRTGQRFWSRLFAAAQAGQRNPVGYTYALARKSSPETLTIWHDGHVVLRSLANTGIPVAPTASGTFPVYLRYRFQIMRGTNPDGSQYADPVSYVAYFNGGDAVHYFPRGSYGFQQSLGCVELPYGAAQRAWPFLTYGSLVTVTG